MLLESVEVLVDKKAMKVFSIAKFNELASSLEFEVKSIISDIHVINEAGKLEYQLPVLTNKIQLGKSLFSESGNYKLGFKIEGEERLKFSDIKFR